MVLFRYLLWAIFLTGVAWGQAGPVLLPQEPIVPDGENLLFPKIYEQLPGLGLERLVNQGALQVFSSSESVGDGASLMVYQHESGGALFSDTTYFETLENQGAFTNHNGISFWLKGDGTDTQGVIAFTSMDPRKGPSTFGFSLSNTNWHKVFAPWTEFFPRLRFIKKPSAFVLGFVSEGVGVRWYLMDRLHLYKDEKVEDIASTPATAWLHDLDVSRWIRKAGSFDEAYRKLENQEQFSLVFLVDEEAVGRTFQPNVIRDAFIQDENFPGKFGYKVQKRFLYHEGYSLLEIFSMPRESWIPVTDSPLRQARFETATLVFRGVQTEFMTQHFKKIASYRPDLVVVQHGFNDMLYGSVDRYREALRKVVQKLKEQGAAVVLCSPFPVSDFSPREHLEGRSPWEVGASFAQVCNEVAQEFDVSFVDCYAAFNARGPQALGEVFFHRQDLKIKGHQMAADLLYGLIDDRRVKIWRDAPSL